VEEKAQLVVVLVAVFARGRASSGLFSIATIRPSSAWLIAAPASSETIPSAIAISISLIEVRVLDLEPLGVTGVVGLLDLVGVVALARARRREDRGQRTPDRPVRFRGAT
jgi:hypothetical protein